MRCENRVLGDGRVDGGLLAGGRRQRQALLAAQRAHHGEEMGDRTDGGGEE